MRKSKKAYEAYETYINGNITEFKEWLKTANKMQIMGITWLWQKHGQDFLRLKSYMGAKDGKE